MIHLDNNLVSHFAQNREDSKKLNQYLHDKNEFVIIQDFLLNEATGGRFKKENEERITFFRRLPFKRGLNKRSRRNQVELELAWLFNEKRIPSKREYIDRYTFPLNRDSWPVYYWQFKRMNERAKEKIRLGQMAYAHLKDVHEKWGELKKKKMRDYFFPPKNDPIIDSEFISELKSKAMLKVKVRESDREAFQKYAENQIDKQVLEGIRKVENEMIDLIAIFDLDFEAVCEMDYVSFFEMEGYLKVVYQASTKLPLGLAHKFRQELKAYSFCTPSGFGFHWQAYLTKQMTPDLIKPNDANDLQYLFLLPYTSVFTCDNQMKDTLKRVVKYMKLPNDGTEIVNKTEFLKKIGVNGR
jgi:hypothetical protein